eukprot:1768951-Prorocentrum_lima.AAC.1
MLARLIDWRKRVTEQVKPLLPGRVHVGVGPVQQGGCKRTMVGVGRLVQRVETPPVTQQPKSRKFFHRGAPRPAALGEAVVEVLDKVEVPLSLIHISEPTRLDVI